MIYIGIDDTDIQESIGTGRLARMIMAELSTAYDVHGVVRHQLFFDPRVPYTAKNSSASIILNHHLVNAVDLTTLFAQVKAILQANFQVGSDPGLAIGMGTIAPEIIAFGKRAKSEIVTQDEARNLAREHAILLEGLGGTNGGIIGALSSVGLAHAGDDGRYIFIGDLRELEIPCTVRAVQQAGVPDIMTTHGQSVHTGIISGGRLRPSRRQSQPILFVEAHQQDDWHAIKFD